MPQNTAVYLRNQVLFEHGLRDDGGYPIVALNIDVKLTFYQEIKRGNRGKME